MYCGTSTQTDSQMASERQLFFNERRIAEMELHTTHYWALGGYKFDDVCKFDNDVSWDAVTCLCTVGDVAPYYIRAQQATVLSQCLLSTRASLTNMGTTHKFCFFAAREKYLHIPSR